MSESDLSGRLLGPVTGRPRRPLSISASTASCSMRFSFLMMISGAESSRNRLTQLLWGVAVVVAEGEGKFRSGGRKAPAVELHHRAQFRRNHRHGGEDHPLGL